MEDEIRRLCSELLHKTANDEITAISLELRDALHHHNQRLRKHFGAYPSIVERRNRNPIPPVDEEVLRIH